MDAAWSVQLASETEVSAGKVKATEWKKKKKGITITVIVHRRTLERTDSPTQTQIHFT